MSTPEGAVKAAVKLLLKKHNVYWHCVVQNGMGAPSLDFICCSKVVITPDMVGQEVGLYLAIETKAPGKKPTPRQEITIGEIRKAGGMVFVIDGDLGPLEEWLNE